MDFDLNYFAYFVAIVEHNGFTRAAAELGVSKSRLSRAVAELERCLGTRLVERTTRHVAITNEGWAFYKHCHAIVSAADSAYQCIEAIREKSVDHDAGNSANQTCR